AGSYLPLVIPFAISSVVAILFGWLYGRIFEGLPFRALGCAFTGRWFRNLAGGMLIGAFSLTAAVLLAAVVGGLKISVNHDSPGSAIWSTLATTLVIFAVGALSEETLF